MAVSGDLISFDLIETHKENIQQLPGGRSARQLVNILSPVATDRSGKTIAPSLEDTRTLNEAIRQEYEVEVQNIAESDDPLDVFDRYVKWTLNAYPSAQATPQSQLLPLLERATKAFLSSSLYKNDPRYLKLWLHYIRWFSDAPRETFAYLSRHHIGEGLALFYEEFAAWLETAGRWAQAEEVYKLGIDREARPVERLMRKFAQFQHRLDSRPAPLAHEPTSPALPTVRPALAAKIDPFASTPRSIDPLTGGASNGPAANAATARSSARSRLTVFSDAANATPPATAPPTNGWQTIGSLQERTKENTIAAKPWAGETLKAGKRAGTVEKMNIFKDQTLQLHDTKKSVTSASSSAPPVVNSKTGKPERVFVNLEAVYPNSTDPSEEMSFDELRAIHRGWADKDWSEERIRPLKAISGNALRSQPMLSDAAVEKLSRDLEKKASLDENEASQQSTPGESDHNQSQSQDAKPAKQKRMKIREVKQETQTIKTNLASPTGPKIRRKLTVEPTMTFHSKAATNDVYDLFNQPLKCEASKDVVRSGCESDIDDDGYSTAGDDTGTGLISGAVSENGNENTSISVHTTMTGDENTGCVTAELGGEWTDFSTSRDVPAQKPNDSHDSEATDLNQPVDDTSSSMAAERGHLEQQLRTPIAPEGVEGEIKTNTRFVPVPPEDYDPSALRTFREPSNLAQSRLPFMTPIVEKTESSLAANTACHRGERDYFTAKTPSRSSSANNDSPSKIGVDRLLLSSPFAGNTSPDIDGGKVRSAEKPNFPTSPSPKSKREPIDIVEEQDDLFSPRKRVQISKVQDSPTRIRVQTMTNPISPITVHHGSGFTKPSPSPPPPPPAPRPGPPTSNAPIITELQCNPTDPSIRRQILANIHPSPSSYPGFFNHPDQQFGRYSQLQKYAKKVQDGKVKSSPRKPNEKTTTQGVAPHLSFTGVSRAYAVKRELGQGAFAPVYLVDSYDSDGPIDKAAASNLDIGSVDPVRGPLEAVKVEAPPNQAVWELHIIRSIHDRLDRSRSRQSIIAAHECHAFADEAYLILDYLPTGTLLDLVNVIKAENKRAGKGDGAGLDEMLAMFFSVELLRTMESLHRAGILHGDLKGDNCLVRLPLPGQTMTQLGPYSADGSNGWANIGIKLIDFGRGIDVTNFPARVGFIADWAAGATDAPEIREARPWVWQIDLWGAAGVVHSLLFGRYIDTVPVDQGLGVAGGAVGVVGRRRYRLKDGLKRYWQGEIWGPVFEALLNPTVPSTTDPDHVEATLLSELASVRGSMETYLELEGERKGLRSLVRRVDALVARRR